MGSSDGIDAKLRRRRRAPNHNGRILVVDDDELVRALLADALEEDGHSVMCARDGAEALRAMRAEPVPSLVLLDLTMPRVSGWEVLEAMRSSRRLAHVPVVVLTASLSGDDLPHARRVLHKPIRTEELCEMVRDVLGEGPVASFDAIKFATGSSPQLRRAPRRRRMDG